MKLAYSPRSELINTNMKVLQNISQIFMIISFFKGPCSELCKCRYHVASYKRALIKQLKCKFAKCYKYNFRGLIVRKTGFEVDICISSLAGLRNGGMFIKTDVKLFRVSADFRVWCCSNLRVFIYFQPNLSYFTPISRCFSVFVEQFQSFSQKFSFRSELCIAHNGAGLRNC